MRVGDELVDLVDRRGSHFRGLEHRKPFGERARLDEVRDHAVAFVDVAHAVRVGAEARIVDHVGAADRAEQPLGHALDRGRNRDETAVLRLVNVTRRGVVRAASDADRQGKPLARLHVKLVDFIVHSRARPWAFGEVDCCLAPDDWNVWLGLPDVAADLRGT